ncbi:hypothetical protein [Leptospira borgpetersenii]|uniref:Glycosyltransferase RgtA/B/C/D-like domain-containing protein n=1 Tax=Leptospira borgpetersenii serovar Hardjo-bovis (strain JB197) TaxID=355277 RepID=Q04V98_LEPBJ|nr:hypothetical protein [Leptospira borgpetersenii]ABJ75172.1 Conserved hypothetical protein [Leptospira borgpetersenii serovar Hardjo-bovis str. JB197]AMX70244.1 membrane protein [Leptospira borgpetersenii serovar Hardjo]TQE59292.1 hypothetical protein FFZ96_00790 [Leptospira borgpetersenii]
MDLSEAVLPKKISSRIILFFLFLLYTVLFYHSAWLSDDSFITFRVVDNFLNGLGLRWNPWERVQVYTHPLWLFLLVPTQWIVQDISASAYILSYACGILFLSVYCLTLLKFRYGLGLIFISLLTFFSSRIFIDYNTSGLENPLSFLLLLLFEIKFYSLYLNGKPNNTTADSLEIGLLAGLLLLTRLDLILFLVAPSFILLVKIFRDQRIQFLKYSFLGIFIWLLYLGFSLVYFGSPFPNTFYAKTNVLPSFPEQISVGWDYLRISLKWDLIALFIFGMHLFWIISGPVLRRLTKTKWTLSEKDKGILFFGFASIVLVFLYLLRIGGDFMAGRFLGTCLIVSVFSQSLFLALHFEGSKLNIQKFLFISSIIVSVYFFAYSTSPLRYIFQRSPIRVEKGIVDERASYQDNTSLKYWFEGITPDTHPWAQYAKKIALNNPKTNFRQVQITTNVGLPGFYGGPGIHWIDLLGITDPFLARLPGKGFPGHYIRLLPQGYKKYIEETAVSLSNPELDRFFYEIRLLSEEDIWTKERWKVIVDFTFFGAGNFKTRFPKGFFYAFDLDTYRITLYGLPFKNWKDEDLKSMLSQEYFGIRPTKTFKNRNTL